MKLTIKNSNVLPLARWLNSVALPGTQSRARTKFVDLLSATNEEFYKQRDTLRESRVKKDDKGEAVTELDKETGISSIVFKSDKAKEDAEKEFLKLLDKEVELVVKDDIFQEIKNAVLGTGDKFEGELASQYNEWCEAFESAK